MKLHTLYTEYKNTEVIEGSAILFFWCFWMTKLLSILQRKSGFLDTVFHRMYARMNRLEFVIKNAGGMFVVQPFDDSTTICADYFEQEIRDWLLTPTKKNIFIDIGANRGIYSVRAPHKYGYQSVHALEPNKEMFDVLTRNSTLNDLDGTVTCHHIAAGKEAGTVAFSVDPMHKGGGQIVTYSDTATDTVSVESLDTILTGVPAADISYIKIDTEGYEFDVLAGMSTILQGMTAGSCLMIETTKLEKLVEALTPYGFACTKSHNEDHLFIKGSAV